MSLGRFDPCICKKCAFQAGQPMIKIFVTKKATPEDASVGCCDFTSESENALDG
jgi:hypothetical protein